jgi:formiminoglutamase
MKGWEGRVDAEDGILGLRWHQVVQETDHGSAKGIWFIGYCSDEGIRRNQGRIGSKDGPAALRQVMSNLAHRPDEFLFDAGDIQVTGNALEAAQEAYAMVVKVLLEDGSKPIGLGGGHDIAWASWQGLVGSQIVKPGDRVGILNLDAHFDMREYPVCTSGTSFAMILPDAAKRGIHAEYRAYGISEPSNTLALFERANQAGVVYKLDTECGVESIPRHRAELEGWCSQLDHVYLSICLDILPASVAPGVSAPAAYGVSPEVIEAFISVVAGSGKLRVADVAELCPRLDIDSRTARVAGRLIWRIVRSWSGQ